METLFAKLIPYNVPYLTKCRIGKRNDGGYVIPLEVLKEVEAVVSFGINDEDSFEQGLTQYLDPKKIPFLLCDPFTPYTKQNDFQFHSIGLAAETKENMISWPDFKKRFGLENKKILLKMDIEGAEWPSLCNVGASDFSNVLCLIMELHGLTLADNLKQKQDTLTKINESFTLVHCHSNNHGAFQINTIYILPDVLECTFLSNDFIREKSVEVKPRQGPYPSEFDQPNTTEKEDPIIYWWIQDIAQLQRHLNFYVKI